MSNIGWAFRKFKAADFSLVSFGGLVLGSVTRWRGSAVRFDPRTNQEKTK